MHASAESLHEGQLVYFVCVYIKFQYNIILGANFPKIPFFKKQNMVQYIYNVSCPIIVLFCRIL